MSSLGEGRSRRSDARANHAALLAAAAAYMRQGTRDLPYDEIAGAAGVGRATVYRHFPTRDALSRAVVEAFLDRWEATVAATEPGAGRFEAVFRAWVRLQQDRALGVDLLSPCLPEDCLVLAKRRLEATLRRPLRAARDDGSVRADVTPADARVALTMLSATLRSTSPAGDRRRAVHLARSMIFVSPPAP